MLYKENDTPDRENIELYQKMPTEERERLLQKLLEESKKEMNREQQATCTVVKCF